MAEEPYAYAFAARRDNPHKVTSIQVGAVPIGDLPDLELSEFTVTAQDAFNAFDPAIITGFVADTGNSAHFGKVVGIVKADTASGFPATVITSGSVQNPNWSWTAGSVIFLNGTTLSQTPPSSGFIQQIGIAKASDAIFVDLPAPIQL